MIALLFLQALTTVILVVFAPLSLLFGQGYTGIVEELPFGMDDPVNLFSSSVHGILVVMPPFEVVWTVILTAFLIKIALLGVEFVMWLIGIIRG